MIQRIIILSLIVPVFSFAHELPDISKEWNHRVEKFQEYVVSNNCSDAIEESKVLLEIDPASTEAMFYLYYSSKKCGSELPEWLGEPSSWPNGAVEERYYIGLAQTLGSEKVNKARQ
ncbi:hypothetical protein [Microbulbifer hydrolyticus]|uniref:Tetratricopeptide repeat protein n=1 Tax=Microbulbifer hydrolyticus TaxID=48074 RepID=A0A6P1TAI9_9GAMM|nr:hypothetical protein [Microbulbifer hydrolyticus]MBB5213119.1 hypothetical protein [Microbulbifer hydrolyticus]QHQ38673.1 hypothetical protein GTQ55_06500 [Microbulbifer hydrolyticus]